MERRLAAILVADVVGYTRLMEADEAGTELEIDVLGEMKPAKIIPESPYDPDNAALRA